jgi:hypothetical protein
MNIKRTLSTITLSTLMVAGFASVVLAQDGPVSGAPSPGFFNGSLVEAVGEVVKEQVDLEAPSLQVTVEGRTIQLKPLDVSELAAVQPEASINQQAFEVTAYPQVRFNFSFR